MIRIKVNLAVASSQIWLNTVLENFDHFLQDHANCERKASSMVLSFVAKYPDRTQMIPKLIEISLEELTHFQQVYQLMEKRGVQLPASMEKDLYAKQLFQYCHTGRDAHLLDRLVIMSVIETRGAERFKMIADGLKDSELQSFYQQFWVSEAKHGHIFIRLARYYFSDEQIQDRVNFFVDKEAAVIQGLPIRAMLH